MPRYNKQKVGRNSLCPCGSGSKFKFCHGRHPGTPPGKHAPIGDQVAHVAKAFKEQEARQQALLNRVGHIHVPATANIANLRIVSVFNRIYQIDKRQTPMDFMDSLMTEWFGETWWNAEIAKPDTQRHPVAFWSDSIRKHRTGLQRDTRGYVSTPLSGINAAWYTLAWDMWVTANHGLMTERMLHRLRLVNEFQGARYELTAITVYLRAGYKVVPEAEDQKGVLHPEFVASKPANDELISVEAKSRHRPGILGYPGNPEEGAGVRAGITRLLHQAISKSRPHPHVAFIDLNLPPFSGALLEEPPIKEVMSVLQRKFNKFADSAGFPASLIIFTNNPHHYSSTDKPNPNGHWAFWVPPKPLHPFRSPDVIQTLTKAMQQYGSFPYTWENLTVGPAIQ